MTCCRRKSTPLTVSFLWIFFLVCFFILDYDSMCSEMDFTPEKSFPTPPLLLLGQNFHICFRSGPRRLQKIQEHFYNSNFHQKWGPYPLISLHVTLECIFFGNFHYGSFLGPILEGKINQNNKSATLQQKKKTPWIQKLNKTNPL